MTCTTSLIKSLHKCPKTHKNEILVPVNFQSTSLTVAKNCIKTLGQKISTMHGENTNIKMPPLESPPCWRADDEQIAVGRAALGAPLCWGGFGLETQTRAAAARPWARDIYIKKKEKSPTCSCVLTRARVPALGPLLLHSAAGGGWKVGLWSRELLRGAHGDGDEEPSWLLAQRYGHADALPGPGKPPESVCRVSGKHAQPQCGRQHLRQGRENTVPAGAALCGSCSFRSSWLSKPEICPCLRNPTASPH